MTPSFLKHCPFWVPLGFPPAPLANTLSFAGPSSSTSTLSNGDLQGSVLDLLLFSLLLTEGDVFHSFFNLFNLLLAALGLPCCARVFSSCGERGPLFVVVPRPLIAVASLVVEHGL